MERVFGFAPNQNRWQRSRLLLHHTREKIVGCPHGLLRAVRNLQKNKTLTTVFTSSPLAEVVRRFWPTRRLQTNIFVHYRNHVKHKKDLFFRPLQFRKRMPARRTNNRLFPVGFHVLFHVGFSVERFLPAARVTPGIAGFALVGMDCRAGLFTPPP
jgi:hypothetical protein